MKKIAGILFAVLALSLVVLPAPILAASLDKDCDWETVKWMDNKDSAFLYLNNWGRTPITAMSRLSGGAYPGILTNCTLDADMGECFGICAACNDKTNVSALCKDAKVCNVKTIEGKAYCAKCWGVSLAFANKSWSGDTLGDAPRISDKHPNHYGNSDSRSAGGGGDWGISGSSHAACKADIWALQCNLDKESACLIQKISNK